MDFTQPYHISEAFYLMPSPKSSSTSLSALIKPFDGLVSLTVEIFTINPNQSKSFKIGLDVFGSIILRGSFHRLPCQLVSRPYDWHQSKF